MKKNIRILARSYYSHLCYIRNTAVLWTKPAYYNSRFTTNNLKHKKKSNVLGIASYLRDFEYYVSLSSMPHQLYMLKYKCYMKYVLFFEISYQGFRLSKLKQSAWELTLPWFSTLPYRFLEILFCITWILQIRIVRNYHHSNTKPPRMICLL